MRKVTCLVALLGLAPVVQAECFIRSTATSNTTAVIQRVADIRPVVTNGAENTRICNVTFRVQIANEWHDAVGSHSTSTDMSDKQLCGVAVELGKTQIAKTVYGSKIHSEQLMFCSDEPKIVERPVKEGDVINESMVKPHPNKPLPFRYNGTQCKWFIETDIKGTDVYQWQGVICELRPNTWKVISKF